MAKLSFSKLKCKINEEIKIISFNEEDIEVRQYLPAQEKLGLISRVITQSHEEDQNYANPVKIKIFTDLEILYAYTNIAFTEKQKENTPKLYDIVYSSGLLEEVKKAIPNSEYNLIVNGVFESLEAVYNYIHSDTSTANDLLIYNKYYCYMEYIEVILLLLQSKKRTTRPMNT